MITNQNTPVLPLEILDRIFSFLEDERSTWSTLEACSDIRNPILRAAIDRRMYTHICLFEWISRPISFDKIYAYLSRNQHVANYIRTLDIIITDNKISTKSKQWYNQASSILQMLTSSLEKITLSDRHHIDATGTEPRTIPFVLSDFPATFHKAFLDCLWSPGIIEASLKLIGGFSLSIFNPCTQLKKLSLLQATCIPSISDARFPPQIDSLVLSRNGNLATIVSWVKTGHGLRSLNFGLDNRADQIVGFGHLIELLNFCSGDLTELELDIWYLTSSDFDPCKGFLKMAPSLTLSHNRKLTQLTIATILRCDDDWCVDSLNPGIVGLVATSPSLKRLTLLTSINTSRFDVTALADSCEPLVSLVDHCSLEHIELRILSLRREEWYLQKLRVVVGGIFMRMPELEMLSDKGFLSITGPEIDLSD